jgi:hypothetical protein
MQMKLITAAALAVTATSSFAVQQCGTQSNGWFFSTAEKFVNTCAPEVTFFVAGSSALGGNINAILPDLFDSTKPLVKVVDNSATGSVNGNKAATTAYYGTSKPAVTGGTGKRVFVVYNNNNGSAAGVSLVMGKLGKTGNPVEANIVTVGPIKSIDNTCVEDPAASKTLTVNGTTITFGLGVMDYSCINGSVMDRQI